MEVYEGYCCNGSGTHRGAPRRTVPIKGTKLLFIVIKAIISTGGNLQLFQTASLKSISSITFIKFNILTQELHESPKDRSMGLSTGPDGTS